MKRTLVMSDIHGELEMFERLLNNVNYNPQYDQLILLGDYVDRGPNAKLVLEKVIQLKGQGAIVLKGNHEDMMIKALTTNDEKAWKHWITRSGGGQTLASYGFNESEISFNEDDVFSKPEIHSKTLLRHLDFIQNLDPIYQHDETIFVHAGVHPSTPIADTDPYVLMWIREEFHNGYAGDKTVIFGHTPTKNLHLEHNNNSIFFGENRIIGIDGGAVYGGQLNCLELPTKTVFSVK
ncbi:metallophosphoesterase family protein [Sporosarcina limicola]|uniref:Serine/threonine protein phosphatase 1 n=1 Tax=Sporosarcina limicola TaxID=34101 RepID=A0A927MI98_9BACL|nr:metallophosphoesterase family protein [Sporosarcina limicola]MBE1554301.1 serine/threonine protein phosphatase 1 [Sporosarcina limicola]